MRLFRRRRISAAEIARARQERQLLAEYLRELRDANVKREEAVLRLLDRCAVRPSRPEYKTRWIPIDFSGVDDAREHGRRSSQEEPGG